MTKKITFLIAAAFMLLTMIVSPVKAVGQTTETLNITSYATANSWVSGTAYTPISTAHVTITGLTNGNNSKYYSSNNSWRHYEGDNGTVTLSVSSDYTLSSVTFTYAAGNSGVLKDGTTNVTSGTEYALSGTTKTFSVGHSSGTKNGNVQIQNIVINIQSASSTTTPTSITIDASGITNTNVFVGTAAGSFSAAVTETASGDPVVGAAVTWTSSDEEVATIGETTGAVTLVAAGTTTITANYAGNSTYSSSSKTYSLTVINQDPNAPGSVNNPYTVAQAIANTPSSGTSDNVYIQGIVSAFYNTSIVGDGTNFRYYISDDGTTANQLLVYRGKGLNEATFTSADDLLVGDEVVIYGKLTLYQSAPEIAANNYLTSWNRPVSDVATPTFSPEPRIYGEGQLVSMSCETAGATIYFTLDGTEPTTESTPYEGNFWILNTTTIKARAYVGTSSSNIATGTYTIIPLVVISNISEVNAEYFVRGTVVATNSRGFVIGDGTEYVYYYKGSAVTQSVGDKVTLAGTTGSYGHIIQFTNTAQVVESTMSNYNQLPYATLITEIPDYSEGYHLSTYLEYNGNLTKSGNNYFIAVGESQIQISYPTDAQAAELEALVGEKVHAKGYFTGINSSGYFTTMLESVGQYMALSIEPQVTDLNTCAATNGQLNVTSEGFSLDDITTYGIDFFTKENETYVGTTKPSWLTITYNEYEQKIGYTVETNNGEARSAYFKFYVTNPSMDDYVSSEYITINQPAYAPGTISVIEPIHEAAELKVVAEGYNIVNDLPITYTNLAVTNYESFGIQFYDSNNQELQEGPDWLVIGVAGNNADGYKVVGYVSENTGDIRSTYFKVYCGDVYSNLFTISQAPAESITLAESSINVSAEENEGYIAISYEYLNVTDASDIVIEVEDSPNWIYGYGATKQNEDGYFAYFHVSENDGAERTASFRVGIQGFVGSYVWSDYVTVTQAGNAAPSASIELNTYSIEAPYTSTNGALTVTYTNINLELEPEAVWFESDGVTPVSDDPDWILVLIDGDNNFEYTIDANTGDARTAYFRIYGLDDDAEDVYSDLVTVTQASGVAPSSYEWVLTDITDLEADDVFVIVGDNGNDDYYALPNDGGTSAPTIIEIEVANGKLSAEPDDNLQWNISGNATNGYTFYPNGDDESWLYCSTNNATGSNNNIKIGTGNRKYFVLDDDNYLVTNDDYADRYLSIYINSGTPQDWRGYVNTDNNAVPISFYKKVSSSTDPSIAITPALVEATAAETPGNMAITISNMTISDVEQLSADFCDANGDDISSKPDWITDFDFQLNAGVFTGTYTIQANTTTEPRTAYFHVYGLDDDGVTEAYSNVVTVNQEASVAPVASITIDPYLVEATADETEGNLAITLENIVITEEGGGSFDLIFCDSNGEPLANQSDKPEWFGFDFPFENNAWSVYYLIGENTTTTARAAYFKVYALGDNGVTEATSDLVTVTQDGAVVYYLVSFDCDGGTFVGNDEFPNAVNENVLAGTHALPSATKSGLTFDGWKLDGTDDIYDAGAQYEVTGNVSFTAQWSSAVTGTITFGSAEGSTAINSTSVNGDDSAGNTWTITTVFSGQTSFTQNASYSQVGASSKPAESITFTTTLANEVNITAFSAKFGGFSNTAGDIALIVDETTIGTGSLNASEDVVVTNTTTESGTVLTVTVTNIAKGVKCYYISYTYEVDDTPSISINPGPYDLNSEGGDAELTVTYTNMPTDPQAEVIFYESNGETPLTENPTWITATINANGNVDGHIDANTGDARSAYFKVKGIDADGNDVYSGLVTVNQAAYTLSIVFETTSLDIEAGGEQNRIISFEYEGLGENPTFTVRQYDASGETQTTYDWLTTTITDVHKVNITVAANTGDARSAYFKVYGENGTINTESNLVTINQAAAAPAGETFTLLTNVDQIVAGQHYLITNGSNRAMGEQNPNNRVAVDVTISAGTATYEGDDVYEVVISGPDANGNYSIYDQRTPGYLFAASSGSNYLRTRAENSDNNSMWKITIDNEGVASIIAQGSNSRNVMRYNGGSSLFACYASASQSPVYLFKKNDEKTYNFYSNTTVASLSVDNDGACIVHEDVALEVTGTITNNGGADNILIMNLGQLINKNNVVATLQRDIKGYGDDPTVADGWQTIASPVDGISTNVVATAPYDLYMYNEPNAYWYSNTGSVPFNTLSRSIGYLYANANDVTLNFAGEMIRTDVAVPQTLSYTSNLSDDVIGFNLMGNPFTCNLNAGDIAWINGDAEYFTSYSIAIPTSANLVTYNINERPIKTGEGFFVQASDENQEISFVKTASKDGVANNGYISINANTEVNFDNAYIQIGNGNTLRKMSIATSSVVYVMNDGDDYAAARVEELAGSMPVYFDAAEDGQCTITITANNLVAHSMHLIDNFTGEDIDLLVNPSYTFFANESDDAARFTLMFDFNDYTGVNESYVNGNFAYQSGDELFVSGDGTLQVFDVMGRFVMSEEIHGSESVSVSAFETGVYMLRFVGENVMTQKIVIR